jgi:hypothetical protein
MFSSEFMAVLKQVLKSWQVIAAAIGVIVFFGLVQAAANPKTKIKVSAQVKKTKRPKTDPNGGKEVPSDVDTGDLGIDD